MKRIGIMLSATLLLSGTAAYAADLNWNSSPGSIYSIPCLSAWARALLVF